MEKKKTRKKFEEKRYLKRSKQKKENKVLMRKDNFKEWLCKTSLS